MKPYWMKPYIMLNTKLRATFKNEFETDFFQLMNNNVFGKTVKDSRSNRGMKLATSREKYAKHVMSNFKDGYPFLKEFFNADRRKLGSR